MSYTEISFYYLLITISQKYLEQHIYTALPYDIGLTQVCTPLWWPRMDQSSWNHGSVGSSPSRALGQQTEMGSGLWYGLADSWLAPMCAFDPLNQAKVPWQCSSLLFHLIQTRLKLFLLTPTGHQTFNYTFQQTAE